MIHPRMTINCHKLSNGLVLMRLVVESWRIVAQFHYQLSKPARSWRWTFTQAEEKLEVELAVRKDQLNVKSWVNSNKSSLNLAVMTLR